MKKLKPHTTAQMLALKAKWDGKQREMPDEIWTSSTYQVFVYHNCDRGEGFPEVIWLSIKRNDREPIHDWRSLQEIKNTVVGKENEAFEIYPAESRLVDTSNQYHLWVFKDKGNRLPVGWTERLVMDERKARKVGAKQRKLGESS
jgi:hypothetical protein